MGAAHCTSGCRSQICEMDFLDSLFDHRTVQSQSCGLSAESGTVDGRRKMTQSELSRFSTALKNRSTFAPSLIYVPVPMRDG